MNKLNLALIASVGLMGAGWVHDYRVGRYYKRRCKKLSDCARMLVDEMERKNVEFDDFTWIAITDILARPE